MAKREIASEIATGSAVLYDCKNKTWLYYTDALEIISTDDCSEVPALIQRAEDTACREKLHAVGWASYEAARGFDGAFPPAKPTSFPLAWFAFYKSPGEVEIPTRDVAQRPDVLWASEKTEEEYAEDIDIIRTHISRGETYQTNYSYRLRARDVELWRLFCRINAVTPEMYAAYINAGEWTVCSASCELFFEREGHTLVSRPMKGTAKRGLWYEDDIEKSRQLFGSEKDRAENVMIVDMVRNDLARVAETGTVAVDKLFEVERHPTLWQMTSTVSCKTQASLGEIFTALFPASSITGAPKVNTMRIIDSLEISPRNIYTGTIGRIMPNGDACFNVAIRTALENHATGITEYGTGGGIVWDSRPSSELAETKAKAGVLQSNMPDFSLTEALLWSHENGYWLLDLHMRRMRNSAEFFLRDFDKEEAVILLKETADNFAQTEYKVRLLCDKKGRLSVDYAPLLPLPSPYILRIAQKPVDTNNPFLYHKTDYRKVYEDAVNDSRGAHDMLLQNEMGELTESTIANVVVEKDGALVTPPVSCGLLAGTGRQEMLESGKLIEDIVHVDDLHSADRIFLVNSVRGLWEATLLSD